MEVEEVMGRDRGNRRSSVPAIQENPQSRRRRREGDATPRSRSTQSERMKSSSAEPNEEGKISLSEDLLDTQCDSNVVLLIVKPYKKLCKSVQKQGLLF